MSVLDWSVLGFLVVSLFFGFLTGLLRRIFTWGGAAIGVILSPVIAPNIRIWFSKTPIAIFITSSVAIVICILGFSIIGSIVGKIFSKFLPPPLKFTDRVGGAMVALAIGATFLWMLFPVMRIVGKAPKRWEATSRIADVFEKLPNPPIGRITDVIKRNQQGED